MEYISHYKSPLGKILLSADEIGLTGLWFEGQKYYAWKLSDEAAERELAVFGETKQWLDLYFTGKEPGFMPPVHMRGTDFQLSVGEIQLQIPYGKTVTYGDIARKIAEARGLDHMSAQAVGSAVGHNRISIIIPCHRVVGADGSLTGYAGGVEKKKALLSLENKPCSSSGIRSIIEQEKNARRNTNGTSYCNVEI